MMDPITNYGFGKARHREIEAEFARYWPEQINKVEVQSSPKMHRLILGLGSITLGALMIVQAVVE